MLAQHPRIAFQTHAVRVLGVEMADDRVAPHANFLIASRALRGFLIHGAPLVCQFEIFLRRGNLPETITGSFKYCLYVSVRHKRAEAARRRNMLWSVRRRTDSNGAARLKSR